MIFLNFISYIALTVDWRTSVELDPIKCYVGPVGEETEETCDLGSCEKTGGMYSVHIVSVGSFHKLRLHFLEFFDHVHP